MKTASMKFSKRTVQRKVSV